MKVYLDTCCLCRLFDDHSQLRIFAESEAIVRVLDRIGKRELEWVSSGVLEYEIRKTRDEDLRSNLLWLLRFSQERVFMDEDIQNLGKELQNLGFSGLDSLHMACAQIAHCSVFLTTDDRLLRKAENSREATSLLSISLKNPLYWWLEVFEQ
ncbi:MAG: PIN domain-containing protein [Candidatus Omnitrophica bacterium]|nr:PIN domain-containing protein [Candidatus Omnitrophota bacterium]